jgi:hypothetical protein
MQTVMMLQAFTLAQRCRTDPDVADYRLASSPALRCDRDHRRQAMLEMVGKPVCQRRPASDHFTPQVLGPLLLAPFLVLPGGGEGWAFERTEFYCDYQPVLRENPSRQTSL